jgi:hypothetical protein
MTVEAPAAERVPTQEAPTVGRIVSPDRVLLSEAKRWVEDGVHVIQSTEFEVTGEGDSLEDAVEDFVRQAIDYHTMLTSLVEEEDATEHEQRVAAALGARVFRIAEAILERPELDRRRHFETPFFTLHLGRPLPWQRLLLWLPSNLSTSKQLSHA